MAHAYRITRVLAWHQNYKRLQDSFGLWAEMRGAQINWAVDNRRGYRDVTLRYTVPPDPEVTLHVNSQDTAEANLQVLALAIEAMRLNERRGIADVIREAYLALPAGSRKRDPWEVLGLKPDESQEVVDAVFRAKAKKLHPDTGGDVAAFRELQEAYEAVKA